MMKGLIISILSLIMICSCSDNKPNFSNCQDLKHLITYGEIEDNVTLQLTDMQYACGECVKLYRIDQVLYSENDEYRFYFNKEITISLLDKQLEKQIQEFVCESNKYEYILSGGFRRNALGVGKLDVIEGKLKCIAS